MEDIGETARHFAPCIDVVIVCSLREPKKCVFHLSPADVWSRGVARWFRWSLSVADPFVSRCLTSSAVLPFPHPAHRTGRADLPHPALGEDSRNRRSHCM